MVGHSDGHEMDNQGSRDVSGFTRTSPNPQSFHSTDVLAKLSLAPAPGHQLKLTLEAKDKETTTDIRRIANLSGTSLSKISRNLGDDTLERDRLSLDYNYLPADPHWFDRLSAKAFYQEQRSDNGNYQLRSNTTTSCSASSSGTRNCAVDQRFHFKQGQQGLSLVMVLHRRDGDYFLIPRLQVGNLVFLPQPPRGEQWEPREIALYHSTKAAPSHFYLATYLWARQTENGFGAHALVHFGTHGSQEWLPGKERGLAVDDYPMLAVGDLPVAYPYIADDVGEAVQAKRRGRAVIISHQPPPFVPAGLHDATNRLHDLLHAWLAQEDGAVKDKLRTDLTQGALDLHIDKDLGWSREQIQARFSEFVDLLHNHLHELAQTAQPLGLHTLGRSPDPTRRIATVLMMLGRPFWAAASPGDAQDEALVGNYDRLPETAPYRLLATYLADRDHAPQAGGPVRPHGQGPHSPRGPGLPAGPGPGPAGMALPGPGFQPGHPAPLSGPGLRPLPGGSPTGGGVLRHPSLTLSFFEASHGGRGQSGGRQALYPRL